MPGLFGVVGPHQDLFSDLRRSYRTIWGSVEERSLANAWIGGHAFAGSAVSDGPDNSILARDGAVQVYAPDALDSTDPGCGNLAQVFPNGELRLASDMTGAFPLYYVRLRDGVAFSTLLKPLADAVGASMDEVGVSTFLRLGYTFNGRTLFRELTRMKPGQVVSYRSVDGFVSEDRSDAWTSIDEDIRRPEDAAEAVRDELRGAVARLEGSREEWMLMVSAGWDSRTVLATAVDAGATEGLLGYSHGDPESRELRIARQLCKTAGVPWRAEAIGPGMWTPEHLDWTFSRVETLLFPHWAWAGREGGSRRCVASGVLGEVLGGHYGETQVSQGRAKITAFIRGIRPGIDRGSQDDRERVTATLAMDHLGRPWYLDTAVEDDLEALRQKINGDVRADIDVLVKRGVGSRQRLIEAFITEHRGAQYICSQALSARGETDVAQPFGDPDLFRWATRIPASVKIHNRVNRALVSMLAPALKRFPMAATLVPASWPLLTQEASRGVRKLYEEGRWVLHHRSGGRTPVPRLGWVDFGFLREEGVLESVLDTLQADLWDMPALRSMATRAQSDLDGRQLHPLFDQLGKILTVDRLIG